MFSMMGKHHTFFIFQFCDTFVMGLWYITILVYEVYEVYDVLSFPPEWF